MSGGGHIYTMIASLKFNKRQLKKRKSLQEIEDFYEEHSNHRDFPPILFTKTELAERKIARRYAWRQERRRKLIGTAIAVVLGVLLVYLIYSLTV